jgi:hypothetical protein
MERLIIDERQVDGGATTAPWTSVRWRDLAYRRAEADDERCV